MNQESALAKAMMLELLSGGVQMKHNDDWQKKTYFLLFMTWGCMSFKGPEEITIITSTINAHVYIEILDNFFITLIENRSDDDEVIFRDGIASQRG